MRTLSVHFLPSLTTPEELAGGTVVVLDVLRASTTIIQALASGAKEVIPCQEINEALSIAAKFAPGTVLLGGERKGIKIEGFDLGNSPGDYTPERVGGKTLVFTTTNGTRAMMLCRQAKQVLIGAAVNVTAIAKTLDFGTPVHLLCAGTNGQVTREDVLVAGMIARRALSIELGNDEFYLAIAAATDAIQATPQNLYESFVLHSQGGKNLHRLGLDTDILAAAQIDRFSLVPRLEMAPWRIVADRPNGLAGLK